MIPTFTLDHLELGARAVGGLRFENRGLASQRLHAIKDRRPPYWGWSIDWSTDGLPLRMRPMVAIA